MKRADLNSIERDTVFKFVACYTMGEEFRKKTRLIQ